MEAGVAKKSGAWYTYGEERLGQGREAAKQTLRENPDLREELETKVREAFDIPLVARTAEEAEALTPAAKPAKRGSVSGASDDLRERLRAEIAAIEGRNPSRLDPVASSRVACGRRIGTGGALDCPQDAGGRGFGARCAFEGPRDRL